jgi:23S rRNA maturation mini-RNase III
MVKLYRQWNEMTIVLTVLKSTSDRLSVIHHQFKKKWESQSVSLSACKETLTADAQQTAERTQNRSSVEMQSNLTSLSSMSSMWVRGL